MVRLRLQRYGRKNRPFYRISAIEKRVRRDGPAIESLGFFDPLEKDPAKALRINDERMKYWLSKGAQPTDTIRDMLAKRGLVDVKAWEADRKADREMVAKKVAEAPKEEKKGEKKEAPKPKPEKADKAEKAEAGEKKEG